MPRKLTDTTAVQDQATAATVKDQTRNALISRLARVAETYGGTWEGWSRAVVDVLSTPAVPLHADPLPLSQDGMAVMVLELGGPAAVLEDTVTALEAESAPALAARLVAMVLDLRDRMAGSTGPSRGPAYNHHNAL